MRGELGGVGHCDGSFREGFHCVERVVVVVVRDESGGVGLCDGSFTVGFRSIELVVVVV